MNEEVMSFITFCTEMYAKENKMSGAEVAELFCKIGVFDFLEENYIELHTQGKNFLLNIIQSFIKEV